MYMNGTGTSLVHEQVHIAHTCAYVQNIEICMGETHYTVKPQAVVFSTKCRFLYLGLPYDIVQQKLAGLENDRIR